MKHLKIFSLIFIFFFAYCKKEKPTITGIWKLEKVETNQKISNPHSYSLALQSLIKTTQIQFFPNNQFSGTIWGDTTYGNWYLINDSLTITDKLFETKFTVFVRKLTQEKLILVQNEDSIKITLIFKRF